MSPIERMEVTPKEYQEIILTQESNGTKYREQSIGSRKKLFVNNKLIATTTTIQNALNLGELNNNRFNSFLGTFNKKLYKQFEKNPELYNLRISHSGVSRYRDYVLWESLRDNTFFYNVDLSSAYWQMAFQLGYIPKDFYNNYIELDDYKEAKRYCISFLARANKMDYKDLNGKKFTIYCDNGVLQNVYDNIRNHLYNQIKRCLNGIEFVLEYNIDGVFVMADELDNVKWNAKRLGLKFKVTECRKLNEYEYMHGKKMRVFKKQTKIEL